MGRIYAGILGPLAMIVALIRGISIDGDPTTILLTALINLFVFAAIGFCFGTIAERTLNQAIRFQMEQKLESRWERESTQGKTKNSPTT